jgi:hypothetical protein
MITKNKEEIEKMQEELENKIQEELERNESYFKASNYNPENWRSIVLRDIEVTNINYLVLKERLEATIKTSIEWCEDEIEFLEHDCRICVKCFTIPYGDGNCHCGKNEWDYKIEDKIKQLQTHLNWLKEQEKKL